MFSNSLPVSVQGCRTEEEKEEDKAKLDQVLADVNLLNSFRKYILLLSDLSDHTLEKYYGMSDEC